MAERRKGAEPGLGPAGKDRESGCGSPKPPLPATKATHESNPPPFQCPRLCKTSPAMHEETLPLAAEALPSTLLSQSHGAVGAALLFLSQSEARLTQSRVRCTRFQDQKRLPAVMSNRNKGRRGWLGRKPNGRARAGEGGGTGQAEGEWREPEAIGEQNPEQPEPMGTAGGRGGGGRAWAL